MTARPDISATMSSLAGPLAQLQGVVLGVYGRYDAEKSLLWLAEEVGELIAAHRKQKSREELHGELADVLAWVLCLANIYQVELSHLAETAIQKEVSRQMGKYGRLKYWDE